MPDAAQPSNAGSEAGLSLPFETAPDTGASARPAADGAATTETLTFEDEPVGSYPGTEALGFSGAAVRWGGELGGVKLIQISRWEPLEITSLTGEDFDFLAASFATVRKAATVTVEGWDDGVAVGTVTFSMAAGSVESLAFGPEFGSIDRLTISADRTIKLDDLAFVIHAASAGSSIGGTLAGSVVEDAALTVSAVLSVTNPDGSAGTVVSGTGTGDWGTFSITAEGVWTYTLDNEAAQVLAEGKTQTDVFTVISADGTASETVTVTVTGTNDAPVAADDEITTDDNRAVAVAVLGNDSDIDGDALTIRIVSGPAAGSAEVDAAAGTIVYTPDPGSPGLYEIVYEIDDGNGGTATATLAVTVDPAAASGPEGEPLFAEQWHLAALGDIGAVWADYTGAGVSVAVYDDGVEYTHPDLDGNYLAALHLDEGATVYDPAPTGSQDAVHGTAVAGVIAAEANGLGTVGIAYGAGLVGVNIFSGPLNINNPFSNFGWAIQQMLDFDVVNHSWGAVPSYLNDGAGFAAEQMAGARDAVAFGRGGLGTIILKAAGNWADSAQGDYYDTTRWTVTVGAYDSDGDASWYTNRGANVLVSAPSSGNTQADASGALLPGSDLRIATTDRDGGFGYAADAWSSAYDVGGFGGTSSATPTVAGVVALMLDANPALGWRDVQTILAYSARETGSPTGVQSLATEAVPVDLDGDLQFETTAPRQIELFPGVWNGADNWNGGGLHFSEDYGFGAVDVFNAVRMAEVWRLFAPAQTSANEAMAGTGRLGPNLSVRGAGDRDTYSFTYSGPAMELDYVDISVGLSTRLMQEVNLTLTSPSGTTITLLDPAINDYTPAAVLFGSFLVRLDLDWTFGAHAFKGEDPNGVWQVTLTEKDVTWDVENFGREADGNLLGTIELDFFGRAEGQFGVSLADGVYHYTDEILALDLASEDARRVLSDEGGTDWLNLAALTADLSIDLTPGATSLADDGTGPVAIIDLDGTNPATTLIENAVTGDGNDVILGNDTANVLAGMRGDDTLTGGASADTFFFAPGFGQDRITDFGDGADLVWLSGFAETSFADLSFDPAEPSTLLLSSGDSITFDGVTAFVSDQFLFDDIATV